MPGHIQLVKGLTPIAFLINTISQKNALDTMSAKLNAIFLGKKDKKCRTKYFKERVVRNLTIKPLIRGITREKRSGHLIQKIGSSENNFSLTNGGDKMIIAKDQLVLRR